MVRSVIFHTSSEGGTPNGRTAFTLIELLVVIAIIGILAAMLMPVLAKGPDEGRKKRARIEMADLIVAIKQYESAYSRLPITGDGVKDGTFGYTSPDIAPLPANTTVATANSDIMVVLMNVNTGVNLNHAKNPQQHSFLEGRMVNTTNQPGVSTIDNQFRDPWGTPYVISLDLNSDGKCRDALYAKQSVSRNDGPNGFNGLVNSVDPGGVGDNFEYSGEVMIWSCGPDGQSDLTSANGGLNKNNVLSWQ